MSAEELNRLVDAALAEDVGAGDWTTEWTVPAAQRARAAIVAKAPGTIAGTPAAAAVFRRLDPEVRIEVRAPDGTRVRRGDTVMMLDGRARSLLTGERTALNLLQRLSGVATRTREYVDRVGGSGARILDTRKTTPGMRRLEKAAVLAGGGANHRAGLHDMVMIKDNHIAAAGGIAAAVEAVRRENGRGLKVEVETTTLAEVEEAIRTGADRILFDNMPPELLRRATERVRAVPPPRPETEASGGITLETVREIAHTGVDFVSVGALTHSAPALDLSMRIERV